MTAQSPGAYGISALLHGAVLGLVLFLSYASMKVSEDTPKIMELVAGSGDNYMATEAPALGVSGGAAVTATAPIQAAPQPVVPQDSPIQAAPEPVPAPAAKPAKPVAKAPAKVPDLVAQLKKTEARRERNLERKYQKEKEAEEKRLSHEEFLREQAAAKAGKVSHVDAEGIREGVVGGSTSNTTGGAGGKALTREESSELDAYFSLIRSRIKDNHTPPEGVSDSLVARVEFLLSADGALSHVRIVKSSGNADFDRSVVEACERTHSNPPRPDHRSETVQMTFRMHEDENT